MGLFINTNIASINARRNLLGSSKDLSRSFQRLSSGLRINSAADDAAGLAISTRFTSQIRGLNQAVRNTNDGISMTQTIEGAMQESESILQRIRELAVQAASDVNTKADRESINAEVAQLIDELNRIGDTTTFNNQKVLNGENVQTFFHVGAGPRETLTFAIKDARATSLGRAAVLTTNAVTTLAFSEGDVALNGVSIRATTTPDDTVSTSLATSSALAKAAAINDSTAHTGVTARALETVVNAATDINGGTLDSTNYLEINGVTITGFIVSQDDADDILVTEINAESAQTGVVASLDSNNDLVLTAIDGRNIQVLTVGNGGAVSGLNAGAAGNTVSFAQLEINSDELIRVTGDNAARGGFLSNNEIVGVTSSNAVSTVDVLSREGANRTIEVIDRAIAQVSSDRAELGAVQNRLESTVSNLTNVVENISASRSRILDADFAVESAALARHQILQQAGTSILAQANQQPQQALALIG